MKSGRTFHIYSPRLANPDDASDFHMEVADTEPGGGAMSFDLPPLSDDELEINAEEIILELDRVEDEGEPHEMPDL